MSAFRRFSTLVAPLALYAASSNCSWTLELDGYRSREEASAIGSLNGADAGASTSSDAQPESYRDYRFPRGAASFTVAAADGLTSGAPADALALAAGSFRTERGGTVELAVDGSFTFTPPGTAGAFWGTDLLDVRTADSHLRVRLTVYTEPLRLTELAASQGAGFGIAGSAANDNLGATSRGLAPAGDINGDGLQDFVLGSGGPITSLGTVTLSEGRSAYVLFGGRTANDLSLSQPPPRSGFFVHGDSDEATLDSFATYVAGAGDVNGDGYDDFIVTSPSQGQSLPFDTFTPEGAVYVVFGKADTNDVASSALLEGRGGGFAIRGGPMDLVVGWSAAGAGDVNGDGLADIILSVAVLGSNSTAVYVVFGKVDSSPVRLADVGSDNGTPPRSPIGFALVPFSPDASWGEFVAGIGDVNGDGLDDIAFSEQDLFATQDTPARFARARVVLGERDPPPLRSLAELEARPNFSYAIDSAGNEDGPLRLQAAGDVNADGLDDVLIGTPDALRRERADQDGSADAGVTDGGVLGPPEGPLTDGIAYVAMGSTTPTSLSLLDIERGSPAGIAISSATRSARTGFSLSSGDLDADGHADVLVSTFPSTTQAQAFLIFGEPRPTNVRMEGEPLTRVLLIEGNPDEYSCGTVASGADANGDGLDDLLIGAGTYSAAPQSAGGAYLVYGYDVRGTLSGRSPALIGSSRNDVFELPAVPPILVRGGHGSDTLRAGPQTPVVDLRTRGGWESLEIIDVRGGGPHHVLLDEVAVRRIPENQPGFAFSLVRRLTVLGDAEDSLELEAAGFLPRGGNAGRTVYGKEGVYYGLEVSPEMATQFGGSVE